MVYDTAAAGSRFLTTVMKGKRQKTTPSASPVESLVDNRPKTCTFILIEDAFPLRFYIQKEILFINVLCRCSTGADMAVTSYTFLESRDQCLHGRLGSVASSRPVGESR